MIRVRQIDPYALVGSFVSTIRETAWSLSNLTGLRVLPGEVESCDLDGIVHHVVAFAQMRDGMHKDSTVSSINIVARLAWNKVCGLDSEPDIGRLLRRDQRYVPSSDIDAVLVAAFARLRIERGEKVPIAWLSVLGEASYDNCLMWFYRRGKASGGVVTAMQARRWLERD